MNDDQGGVATDAALPPTAAVAPKHASPEAGADAGPDTGSEDAARESDSFVHLLFGHAPAEDLAGLSPGSREELAQAARAHLAEARPSGTPSIRLVDREVDRDGRRRDLSLLEVVNADRPFLLASTLAELAERRLSPRLVAHPILDVERDEAGALVSIRGEVGGAPAPGISRESLIHIHLDRIDDALERDEIVRSLEAVYRDVAAVAADVGPMRAQLAALTAEYRDNPPPLALDEVIEAVALLDWLADDTFTLLGMRASRLPADEGAPEPVEGSSLGLLRDPGMHVLKRGTDLVAVTPEIRAFLERPTALIITKASVKSRVGPRDYLDYIGVKLFSPSGRLWGELSIVGLFTPRAYTQPVLAVPYVRRKVEGVIRRAGFDPDSFAGRALVDVLETYPRDEIVQIDEEQLFEFALELERLSEHPRIRVLSRIDRFDRFVSAIVYLPKDRYDAAVRRATGDFLARLYGGRVSAAYPAYPPGTLTRTHFIIGRDGTPTPDVSREELERGVSALARTWADRLGDAFADRVGGPRSRLLAQRYGEAFGAAYRENFDATQALVDIGHLERLSDATPRAVDLYRRDGDDAARVNLKLFSRGASLPLSDRVPLLERLGFRVVNERTYRVAPVGTPDGARTWLHDMALERASGAPVDIGTLDSRMEAALLAVLAGVAESDGYNKLVLEAGLGWRDAALIRALGRYLRQIRIPYGQDYIADVLARHGELVAEIVALFYARFDPHPAEPEGDRAQASRDRLAAMLRDVVSLDDDRILRRFINLVEAASRTNYFQLGENGFPPETVAFKFECAKIEVMPQPRPSFEIFMNGPRVEALHLRFGKVARGGLRWSDRPEDFRTEVLGLVKAQQVKNAVIVPVGAKGGFIPKRLPSPSDRQAWLAEGVESYRTLRAHAASALADNIVGGAVIGTLPTRCCRDGDDPYLVVRGRQGHGDRSRTPAESRSRSRWATGSATPSRPAAPTATTTSHGHHGPRRLGGREAALPRDRHRRPERAP
jgi:glutamate dehydrogenase